MSFFDSLFSDNSAPTQDYSGVNNASTGAIATDNANEATQQNWAVGQDAQNQAIGSGVVSQDQALQGSQNNFGQNLQNEYETETQPEYQSLVNDANSYDSDSRKDQAVGAAQAGVSQDMDAQRNAASQNLESYGISPDATRYAALDIGAGAQKGAAMAAAGTQAGLATDATGRALRSEALNDGALLPGQAAGTFNTGLQAGTGASNTALATTASGANTMGTGTSWASLGNGAIGTYGSDLNNEASNNTNAWTATQKNGGSGLGTALGMGSNLLGNFAMAATGGAIPEMNTPPSQQKGPYNPAHYYAIPLDGGPKGRMHPAEAIQHFINAGPNGRHVGVFNNHHDALTAFGHGSDDPQHQMYGAYAQGGDTNDQNASGQTPGGAIPTSASPTGGAAIDDVNAKLTPGEFIIPKDAASWVGEKTLQTLIQKARQEKLEAVAKPKMGSGPSGPPAVVSTPQPQGAIPAGAH